MPSKRQRFFKKVYRCLQDTWFQARDNYADVRNRIPHMRHIARAALIEVKVSRRQFCYIVSNRLSRGDPKTRRLITRIQLADRTGTILQHVIRGSHTEHVS